MTKKSFWHSAFRTQHSTFIASATLVVTFLTVFTSGAANAQKLVPHDLAAKLTGTWILNRDLSTGFRTPAPQRRGSPLFAVGALAQRRGGGGGGRDSGPVDPRDLTPEQRAEQAAMRQLQQIAERIAIRASPESVTFSDARGERTFAVDGKSTRIDVGGAFLSVKSRWDQNRLKQEFSSTEAKLVQTWGIDDAGRLVLTAKLESMSLNTAEQKAVFDRQ